MGHARGLRHGSATVKIPPSRGRNNARPAVRFLTPPSARPPNRVAADRVIQASTTYSVSYTIEPWCAQNPDQKFADALLVLAYRLRAKAKTP
jgi:hypothetical protein